MTEGLRDREPPGLWLRRQREAAGLTREELAERSGLSVRTISNLEHNRTRRPYPASVRLVAGALDLTETAAGELMMWYRVSQAARSDLRQGGEGAAAGSMLTSQGSEQGQVGGTSALVPRQLPPAAGHFVGRRAELESLTGLLEVSGDVAGAVIIAIGGTAGVGKTALAVQWAHQAADRFPDGQLYVNLRGFDPSGTAVMPAEAVRVLLEALQIPAGTLPQTVEAQLGLYRSMLSGKRMLIVLDNARDEAQVRPLLPGSPTCRVIITSRNQLAGLVAVEAAHPLLLDVLTGTEAHQLLQERLGAGRLAAEPDAAAQIIKSCGGMPLALCVVAARASMWPDQPLAQIASDVATCQNLDAFSGDRDPAADVRAVLSWSYQQLDAASAHAFRLASLHPGPHLEQYAVAALTGTITPQAGRALDALAYACMIQPSGAHRYGMHDLLRSYGRELAAGDCARETRAALTRLLDYYLHAASTAVDTLFPAREYQRPRIRSAQTPAPVFTSAAAALAWLEAERTSLVAAAVHAADHGWPSHAIQLSAILFRYLEVCAYYPEAVTVHTSARHAAHSLGDRVAEANALNSLSAAEFRRGRYQQAASHLKQSAAGYEEIGDQVGWARALSNLGMIEFRQGHCQAAVRHLKQGVALLRDTGERMHEASALANLGFIGVRQGRYRQAIRYLHAALALCQETGATYLAVHAVSSLGEAELRQGRYRQAVSHLQQALTLAREIGDRRNEAEILALLGAADLGQGRYPQATSQLEQALALCRETNDLCVQALVHNGLGELFSATGRAVDARTQHATALVAASEAGEKYEQARAHAGLARAYHVSGDTSKARDHGREALTYYTQLGAPEADDLVRAQSATGHTTYAERLVLQRHLHDR